MKQCCPKKSYFANRPTFSNSGNISRNPKKQKRRGEAVALIFLLQNVFASAEFMTFMFMNIRVFVSLLLYHFTVINLGKI